MRRAEETGEVDGLYKTKKKKKILIRQHPSLHGIYAFIYVFFVYFVSIIKNRLRTIGLNHCPVICGVQLEGG